MKKYSIFLLLVLSFNYLPAQKISDILESAISSVVTVAVFKTEDIPTLYGFDENVTRGLDEAYQKMLNLTGAFCSGSGFVIEVNNKLYIVTNAHVISSASSDKGSISVFSMIRKKYEVKLLGADTFYDVAVLEFVDQPGKEFKKLEFRKKDIRIGEQVFAIGNPLGKYANTVTDGIISGKNRINNSALTGKLGYLQSTAVLSHGNSGGPLIDAEGQVVGLNTWGEIEPTSNQNYQSLQQLNFSLEFNTLKRVVNDLINNNGIIKRAYLGIQLSQRNKIYNGNYFPLDDEPVINDVVEGSPVASVLKNKIGYTLKKINNIEITNLNEALEVFESIKPSSMVKMIISKDDKEEEIAVFAGALNADALESIATHFLSSEKIQIKKNANNFSLKFFNDIDEYYLISAGASNSDFWLVKQLSTLGAILKICGEAGGIYLGLIEKNYQEGGVITKAVQFGGRPDVQKRILYY
jgi:S1-C subfamily serine protease